MRAYVGTFILAAILVAGCPDGGGNPGGSGGTGGSGGDTSEPAWRTVLDSEDLDRVALSVWGTSGDSVYVVGGPLGNTPYQALAIHYDGSEWRDLQPGGDDSFWWVHGTSDSDVWMVGENGRIEHWNGSTFESHDSGTTATIWGVYAFSSTEVWAAAGATQNMMGPRDIILRYDGNTWEPQTLPGMPLDVAHFKVWGVSPDDLYVVGEQGTIWHLQGGTWTNESVASMGRLLTIWGCSASEIYAVGANRVVTTTGDGTWTEVDVNPNSEINGVSCAAPGEAAIVGSGGLKQRLIDGMWVDEFTKQPFDDFHAVWAAGDGEYWIVGGDFTASATPNAERPGVVARYGPGSIADVLTP